MTGFGFTDRPAMTVHGHGLLSRGPSGQKNAIVEGLERGTYLPRPPFTVESARRPGEQREDYVSLSDRYDVAAINFSIQEGGSCSPTRPTLSSRARAASSTSKLATPSRPALRTPSCRISGRRIE